MVLLGTAGWATRRLPKPLSALYVVAGQPAWFVYLVPELEGGVVTLGFVVSIWQAVYLLSVAAQEPVASAPPVV